MGQKDGKRAIALGYFDGVHRGHQALMRLAAQRAREQEAISAVYTFDTHPDTVITGQPVPLITTPSQRGAEIRELGGVDEVIFAHFDSALRTMEWDRFIEEELVGRFGACWVITGENNRFGYRGKGTPEGLMRECARLHIGCDIVPSVRVDGIVVSSTYIRQQIALGDMERVQKFMGHPYTIAGVVEHGRRVGRTLGYPTVNLPLPADMQAPPFGVYVSRVVTKDASYSAVTNIGVHPTFGEGAVPCVEPHILDFSGNLYERFIRVELLHLLRREREFESSEALRAAIARDIDETRRYFAENPQ